MSVIKNNKTIECVWHDNNVSTFGVKDGKVFYMNGTSIMKDATGPLSSTMTEFFFDERNLSHRGYGNYNTSSPVPGNYFTRDTLGVYSTKGVGYFPVNSNSLFRDHKALYQIWNGNFFYTTDNDYSTATTHHENTIENRSLLPSRMRYTTIAGWAFRNCSNYKGYIYIPGATIKSPNGDIYYCNSTAGVYANYMWENSTHKDETYSSLGGNYPTTIGKAAFTWAVGTWWNTRNPVRVAFEGRNTVGVSNLTFSSNVRSVWIFNNANLRLVTQQYDATLGRGMFEGQVLDFFGRTYLNYNNGLQNSYSNMFRDTQLWARSGNGFQLVNFTGNNNNFYWTTFDNMFRNASVYGNTDPVWFDTLFTGMSTVMYNCITSGVWYDVFPKFWASSAFENSNISIRNVNMNNLNSYRIPINLYNNHRGIIENLRCNITYTDEQKTVNGVTNYCYNVNNTFTRANCIRNSALYFWWNGNPNTVGTDVKFLSQAKLYNCRVYFNRANITTNLLNAGTTHYAVGGCLLDNTSVYIRNIRDSIAYTAYGTTLQNSSRISIVAYTDNNNQRFSMIDGRSDYIFRNLRCNNSIIHCSFATFNESTTAARSGAGMFWNAIFRNSSVYLPAFILDNAVMRNIRWSADGNENEYVHTSWFKNCHFYDSVVSLEYSYVDTKASQLATDYNSWCNNTRFINCDISINGYDVDESSAWQSINSLFREAKLGALNHPRVSITMGHGRMDMVWTFSSLCPSTVYSPSWVSFWSSWSSMTNLHGTFRWSSISWFQISNQNSTTADLTNIFYNYRPQWYGPDLRIDAGNLTSNAVVSNWLDYKFNDKANYRLRRDLFIGIPWGYNRWNLLMNNSTAPYGKTITFAETIPGLLRINASSTGIWADGSSTPNYCNSTYRTTRDANTTSRILCYNTYNAQVRYFFDSVSRRMDNLYANIVFTQQNAGNWTATNF